MRDYPKDRMGEGMKGYPEPGDALWHVEVYEMRLVASIGRVGGQVTVEEAE